MTYIEFVNQNLKKLTIEEIKEQFIKNVDKKDYKVRELDEIVNSIYNSIKH